MTREAVRVPPDYAAEMVAYDTAVGEFRVHYAGLLRSGLRLGHVGGASRAVLEVRSHEVPFMLGARPDRRLAALRADGGRPTGSTAQGIGSNYQSQGLALAKQFKAFRG